MDPSLIELTETYPGPDLFNAAPECPICRGGSTVIHAAGNIHPEKPYQFAFRRCHQCGHGWIDPMPSQGLLSHLYSTGSLSVIGAWGDSSMTLPEQVCATNELPKGTGTYLELGVGQGHLYRRFVEEGWQCIGIDPGDWARRFPGVHRRIEEISSDFRADVIAAFDVLEHIPDPIRTLKQLKAAAKPGARLYCATPNVESARARWFKEDWRMVRPMGHVNYYSSKSIRLAMKAAGFEVVKLRATDLCKPHVPRGLRDGIRVAVEVLGLGDQWSVIAQA
jgi:SAM-dependent methyltransferase